MPRGTGRDAQTVIAAQAGDARALDRLLSGYLPLVYNIVGRALNGHADVDDVVQETMLRAVRGLADLRDPAAFRSWLAAVTIRQVRDYCRARQTAPVTGLSEDAADPAADFVDLTILRLGLSNQREETAQATRWLEPGDRDLLALWWQEAAGELDRGEVSAALGLPPRHVAVRVARMKEQLTTSRVVVRALRAEPLCAGLSLAIAGWDEIPSPLWRKRIARHIRDCRRCGAQQGGLIPAEQLLAGLPLVPLSAIAGQVAAATPPTRPVAGAGHTPTTGVGHRAAGQVRHARVMAKTGVSLPVKLAAAAVAVGCVAGGGLAIVHLRRAHPVAAATPVVPASPSAPGAAAEALAQPSARAVRTPVRHRRRPPAHQPPPAAPAEAAGTSAKKGVGAWAFSGATEALTQSGASWYYTWSATPGVSGPPGVQFVPMIWGASDVNASTLSQVKQEGPDLLGFNEPDMASQSDMTPAQALSLWPQLMATGMQLGSPAVADDGATPGGWLDQFMSGATARGYRVNFITLHWYGSDFDTSAAVSELQSYLQAVYARYHLPIWLTEFALANFGGSPETPSPQQQAAFVTAATAMLQDLSYVQRYAWFGLQATSTDGSMGLFSSGPVATATGRAFEAAGTG